MRKKFIAGNWKMYKTLTPARELASALVKGVTDDRVQVAVCPPFPYLLPVSEVLKGSRIGLGAQDCYIEKEGAFTGEVSPAMLLDVGCNYVLVGHSERRHKLGDGDTLIQQKLTAGLSAGLHVILCVGELLAERQSNQTHAVLAKQLTSALSGLDAAKLAHCTIAYEPVWAIGTGHNATPDQAQDAHAFIRKHIATQFNDDVASRLLIQYGGSVKPDNAKVLLSQPDVDGLLVGGASLVADQFLTIIKAGS